MSDVLCVIDPSVTGDVGHYTGYVRSFKGEVLDRGLDFRVLAGRGVADELRPALNAEPVFRYHLFHDFRRGPLSRRVPVPLPSNWNFYTDLRRPLGRAAPQWLLFMPTIDHRHMLGWALWLMGRRRRRLPRIVLLFRYSYRALDGDGWRPTVRWARPGFRILERLGRGRLRLATDSSRLAAEYRRLTRIPVDVFPIPHTEDIGPRPGHGLRRGRGEGEAVRFVSLGDARIWKGYPVLAEAIKLLHHNGQMDGIEFVLQSNIALSGQQDALRARDELTALGLDNVRLTDGVLSRERYLELLLESDVVVLPYAWARYRSRTSGPCCEALAAGKPVIVTEDTWMSDQLAVGAGVTAVDGDPADLARAILEVRSRYRELAEAARRGRAEWLDRHNPVRFVDALLGSGTGSGSGSGSGSDKHVSPELG
jgi:glycosyltransferase involved in cell wall biosynthesis